MFVHAVYFWLERDLNTEQIKQFEEGLESLKQIESVKYCFTGKPSATDRPIIDRTYDYALTVVFDNKEDHDIYREHKIHDVFRDNFSRFFLKVQIYDSE